MHSFYLKSPYSAVSLSVLFSLLGLLFQPMVIMAGAGIALHMLIGNYRLAFFMSITSFLATWGLSHVLFGQTDPSSLPHYDGDMILILFYLPILFSAFVLGKSNNQALAVFINAVVAAICVMLVRLFGSSYIESIKLLLLSLTQQSTIALQPEEIENIMDFFIPSIGISVFIFLTLTLFVGRLWQSRAYNAGGFGREFRAFQLGKTLLILLTIVVALSFFNIAIFDPFMIIALMLLALQGLSLIHFFAEKKQINQRFIVLFYTLLLAIFPLFLPPLFMITFALLALFACIDGWVDFRAKALILDN